MQKRAGPAFSKLTHALPGTPAVKKPGFSVVQLGVMPVAPHTYVDFTKLAMGDHTAQVRFVIDAIEGNDGEKTPIHFVIWSDKYRFTMVPPKG